MLVYKGVAVPRSPKATKGNYVAGARFTASQPPSALHGNIGTQVPLVFDVLAARRASRSAAAPNTSLIRPGGPSRLFH